MANAQIQVTFTENVYGHRNLHHGGYKFRRNKEKNEISYWRCVDKNCKSTLQTNDNIICGFGNHPHNHPLDRFIVHVDEFKQKLLFRAKTETTTINAIFEDELIYIRRNVESMPDDVLHHIPVFDTVRTSMYRARHKTIPKLPKTRAAVQLEGEWCQTDTGEEFLIADDGDNSRILIFATRSNLELLCDSDIIYADGTFYSSPSVFNQLYSFHAEVQGHVYPLVYFLLPDRKEATYSRAFQLLKTAAEQRNLNLSPDIFQVDFEKAAHNAVSTVFPATVLRGCYFHYTQCIWRCVQRLGLVTDYKDDNELRRLVRRAAALPLVPQQSVEDVWLDSIADSPPGPAVTRFMDYVTETWVDGPAQWGKDVWNHHENNGRRTNNNLEGWHHRINNISRKCHPNIYEHITMLKREQSFVEARMAQVFGHRRAPVRKRCYREMDVKLTRLKDQLRRQELTLMQYTDGVSYIAHLD